MQKRFLPVTLALLLTMTSAFTWWEDILQTLGMDQEYANEVIMTRILGLKEFRAPYVKALPEIISGDKVGAAKELFGYVKGYCESSEFATAYAKERAAAKPDQEDPRPDAETIQSYKDLAEYYDGLSRDKSQSAEARAEHKKNAEGSRQLYAEAQDPTPKKTKWEKQYPARPQQAVTVKLNDYLKILGTVDFNAQLTPPDKYKKKMFVNKEYEKKPNEWKAVFRAGKEVNDAISAMVREWLKAGVK